MKKIALIPAYKPDGKMLGTILELKNCGFDIIVTDDGSGIEFSHLFETASATATILTSEQNEGKGSALKKGMKFIKENYDEEYVVVTVDADGQHKTSDAIKVIEEAINSPDSLILGSRKLVNHVPLRSRFGNTITRFVFKISTGKKVYDTQTGLRAFSNRLLPKLLEIKGNRYEYEMNMLMQLVWDSVSIIEVPIETVYIDGNTSSHFDTIKDSYRIYKEILKFSASSLISFCVDYILFCLLTSLTGTVIFSNITARICSSIVNFNINRKMVFNHNDALTKSAVGYFSLAAFILICNTLLVKALCLAGITAYLAKIITEIILCIELFCSA